MERVRRGRRRPEGGPSEFDHDGSSLPSPQRILCSLLGFPLHASSFGWTRFHQHPFRDKEIGDAQVAAHTWLQHCERVGGRFWTVQSRRDVPGRSTVHLEAVHPTHGRSEAPEPRWLVMGRVHQLAREPMVESVQITLPVRNKQEKYAGGIAGAVHDWKVGGDGLPTSHPAMESYTYHNARKRVTNESFMSEINSLRDEPSGMETEPMVQRAEAMQDGSVGVEDSKYSKHELKNGHSSSHSFRDYLPTWSSTKRDKMISVSLLFIFSWSLLGSLCFSAKDIVYRGLVSYREFGSFYPLALAKFPTCSLSHKLPAYPVGVNVIDIADSTDGDPENDGLRGYGSSKARETLRHLSGIGVNMVVLPVDVRAVAANSTEVSHGLLSDTLGRYRFARMIDDAHDAGLSVAVVPHLFLDDRAWRGEIEPQIKGLHEEDALDMWFVSYQAIVKDIATVAAERCVEVLSIGAELTSLTTMEDNLERWKETVEEAQDVFPGKITYSSNWDETLRVPVDFWKEFDFVGVNAFHPLTKKHNASFEEMKEGELEVQRTLKELKASTGRDIWFMELGFRAMQDSAVHPWLWPGEVMDEAARQASIERRWDPSISREEMVPVVDEHYQERAYRAALEAIDEAGVLSSVSFWAVPTDMEDDTHGNPRSMWVFGPRYRENHPQFEPQFGFSFVHKLAESSVSDFASSRPVEDA